VNSIRKQLKGSSDKGFTLIELLVVVLILGILSVIAVVAVNNARSTAIAKACKASAVTVINAADQYNVDKAAYPANAAAAATGALSGVYTSAELGVLAPNYLKKLPDIGTTAPTGSDYALKVTLTNATTGANATVATLAVQGYDASGNALAGCVAP
jgi:prepilin-type N-terminal cleavage/methylation domain-containing protein